MRWSILNDQKGPAYRRKSSCSSQCGFRAVHVRFVSHIIPDWDWVNPTQKALVKKVIIVVPNPAFFPFRPTRLYTQLRSQTLVFIFQLSRRTLKFGANSMFMMSMLAVRFQSVSPDLVYPLKPSPVRIDAPCTETTEKRMRRVYHT